MGTNETVHIANLDELAEHLNNYRDKETQDLLTGLQLSIVESKKDITNLEAQITGLRSDFKENTECTRKQTEEIQSFIRSHAATCPHPEEWVRIWKTVNMLTDDYQQRRGSNVWVERGIGIGISVLTAVLIAGVFFFMNGGHVSI